MSEFFFRNRFFSSIHIWSTQYLMVNKGWNYPNHRHSLFEIMYCQSGEMSEWINGKPHKLRAGDAILINSEAYHYPEAHEDSIFLNFHFDIEPREIHSLFTLIKNPILTSGPSSEPQRDIQHRFDHLIELFRNANADAIPAANSNRRPSFVNMLKLQSGLLDLIGFIIDEISTQEEMSSPLEAVIQPYQLQIAHEAAYFIEQSVNEIVHISQLADKLNVHRNHLTSSFKQVYGVSPKQYLIQARIKKAKQLLQETRMSMNDIAEAMSFSSTGHFCRFFREQTGKTPLQYRSGGGRDQGVKTPSIR